MISEAYKFNAGRQIWRLMVSDTDRLLIESREMNSKEVFFDCLDIHSGDKIFSDLQLEEKHWLGIEAVYKDVIIFHKYAKPDMPGHKEMIAFDINTRKILWTNDEYVFLFVHDEKVYTFRQGFDSREFVALNYRSGEIEIQLGDKYDEINRLREKTDNEKYNSNYVFPEIFREDDDSGAVEVIRGQIKDLEIVGDVEYNIIANLVLINFHPRVIAESLANRFLAVDSVTGKVLRSEILNANVNAYVPNSYFIYKNKILMIKEKNELLAFNLG